MKYALIGCGRIATNHIKAVLNNKLELVAMCDVNEEHITALMEKHGLEKEQGIKRYTDYKKMVAENDLNWSVLQRKVVYMQKLHYTVLIMELMLLSKNRWQ